MWDSNFNKDEFYFNVSKGKFNNYSTITKFGEAPNVGSTEVTLWDESSLYPWPTSALAMTLVSNNVNDSISGTGARKVVVYGLDNQYNEIFEIVELNGTTPVPLINSYFRNFRMIVIDAGSTGSAQGKISLQNSGTIYASILNGNNQTLMGVYSVPANHTAYIISASSSSSSGKSVTGSLYVRPFGQVFQCKYRYNLYQNFARLDLTVPFIIPEKNDIDIRASSSASGTDVTISWQMIIEKNK